MAFSAGGGSNGAGFRGGRRFGRSNGTLSEINIVPLVDVVLVLLIIFMITAHVMEFGLEVEVPKVKNTQESVTQLPVVTITRNNTLYLNEKPVNINQLVSEVKKRFKDPKAVYLAADKTIQWDLVANVMSVITDGGLKISAVTKPLDTGGKR